MVEGNRKQDAEINERINKYKKISHAIEYKCINKRGI